jgi:hypothetical protein
MRRVKTLCMPVLLGVLLLASLVGVASARPDARPQQQAWRVLTVPAAACLPASTSQSSLNNGWEVHCEAAMCYFMCPVNFPAAGEQAVGAVHVKRFTMYAFDNDAGQGIQAWLIKSYPPTANRQWLAQFATADAQATNPQVLMDTTIEYNPVYRTQAPYVAILMGTSDYVGVYGFFVHYTW